MARVKRGVTAHARHKKVLGLAKGYRGRGSTAYRVALEKVEKALRYAYRDRRNRKRDFRGLWIQRINAGVRAHGLTYSKFMAGLKQAGWTVSLLNPKAPDLARATLSDGTVFYLGKSIHVGAYAVLACLACWLSTRWVVRGGLWLGLTGHGALTEYLQNFVEGRTGRVAAPRALGSPPGPLHGQIQTIRLVERPRAA